MCKAKLTVPIQFRYNQFQTYHLPSIISHPANCQLIQQTKNSSKGTKNSISIEELIKDIENWNNKYPNFRNLTQR